MWPMHVVMIDVLIKDQPQVPLAGDQHPIQALAPAAGDPAFRDRVRARRLDRRLDDPDPGCREHGVWSAPSFPDSVFVVNSRCGLPFHEFVVGLPRAPVLKPGVPTLW
jgi:hypothetical protein